MKDKHSSLVFYPGLPQEVLLGLQPVAALLNNLMTKSVQTLLKQARDSGVSSFEQSITRDTPSDNPPTRCPVTTFRIIFSAILQTRPFFEPSSLLLINHDSS